VSGTHFHQFNQEFASAIQTLKAIPKHHGVKMNYVCQFACGNAVWLAAAVGATKLLGIDQPNPQGAPLCIPQERIAAYDLYGVRVSLPQPADLVLCIDFAHTLPEARVKDFVFDLCRSSDRVLFSAPAPFQMRGQGLNLQWPSYWAGLFAESRLFPELKFRPKIWANRLIEPSIRQNAILYVRREAGYRLPVPLENLDVVHPAIFAELSSRQDWFARQLTKSTLSRILSQK
jgi:hypothetical protein